MTWNEFKKEVDIQIAQFGLRGSMVEVHYIDLYPSEGSVYVRVGKFAESINIVGFDENWEAPK